MTTETIIAVEASRVMRFTVDILPRGWARARTRDGRHYTDADTLAAKTAVGFAFRAANPGPMLTGPVAVRIVAVFPPPKATPKRDAFRVFAETLPKATKPDADNIAKLVLDALNGLAWRDDAQVCDLSVRKVYGRTPRLEVVITFG